MGIDSGKAKQSLVDDADKIGDSHEKESKRSMDGWKSAFSRMGDFAGSAVKGIVGTIGIVSGALVTAGVAAFGFANTFETAMAKTSTMFGDVDVNTDSLNKQVLALSNNTGLAADTIGESLYNALSAGIPVTEDMGDAMDFMGRNAKLAKAGFTDIDTAVTATAKILNAYKMDVSETDKVHKILMQTQNNGITTVGELGAVLAGVTPTAAAMNVSFEQVGAGLATMTAQGTPTGQAVTQLNAVLAELGKSGTVASKVLKEKTGKSFQDLMKAGVPLNEVLAVLDETAQADNKSLLDMFGSLEAGKAALSMSGENAEMFTKNLAAMSTETDVVGDAYAKMADTTSESLSKMGNSIKNLGIGIMQDSKGAIAEVTAFAGGLVEQLTTAYGENGLGGLSVAVGDVMSQVVMKIADSAPQIVNAAVGLIQALVSGLLKNAPAIAQGAACIIETLAVGLLELLPDIIKLGMNLIVNLAMGLASALPALVSQIVEVMLVITKTLIENLPLLIDAALEIITALANGLIKALPILTEKAPEIIKSLVDALAKSIPDILIVATELVLALGEAIIKELPKFGENMLAGFKILFKGIKTYFSEMMGKWSEIFDNIGFTEWLENITASIQSWWNGIVEWFNGIPQFFTNLWETISQVFTDGWNAVVEFFTVSIPAWLDILKTWFDELPYNIGLALGTALKNVCEWGENLVDWVATEIPKFVNGIINFIKELPGKVWEWLKATFEKIKTWGTDIITSASESASKMVESVVNFFKELPGKIWEWLLGVINNVKQWGLDLITTAQTEIPKFVDSVVGFFSELPGKMFEIGGNIVSGIWDGITGAVGWLKEKIGGFVSGIVDGFTGKKGLDINSPSKVMRDKVGRAIPESIAVGIDLETDSVTSSIKDLNKDIFAKAQGAFSFENAKFATATKSHDATSYSTTTNDNGVNVNVYLQEPTKTQNVRGMARELGKAVEQNLRSRGVRV